MLPERYHSYFDIPLMVLLVLSPWLFGFSHHALATTIPVVLGLAGLIYGALTNYEASLSRQIPMRVHIGIDIALGAFLALSPWLFAFAGVVLWPHLLFGLIIVGMALSTIRQPGWGGEHRAAHHH
jgi:hypothetical protein